MFQKPLWCSISQNCVSAQFRLSEITLTIAFQDMKFNGYRACLMDEISVNCRGM